MVFYFCYSKHFLLFFYSNVCWPLKNQNKLCFSLVLLKAEMKGCIWNYTPQSSRVSGNCRVAVQPPSEHIDWESSRWWTSPAPSCPTGSQSDRGWAQGGVAPSHSYSPQQWHPAQGCPTPLSPSPGERESP